MGNSQFIKRLIPILLSTFVAWFYVAAYTPLGYIYNTYPGQDALVMSIATIPGVVAMICICCDDSLCWEKAINSRVNGLNAGRRTTR